MTFKNAILSMILGFLFSFSGGVLASDLAESEHLILWREEAKKKEQTLQISRRVILKKNSDAPFERRDGMMFIDLGPTVSKFIVKLPNEKSVKE